MPPFLVFTGILRSRETLHPKNKPRIKCGDNRRSPRLSDGTFDETELTLRSPNKTTNRHNQKPHNMRDKQRTDTTTTRMRCGDNRQSNADVAKPALNAGQNKERRNQTRIKCGATNEALLHQKRRIVSGIINETLLRKKTPDNIRHNRRKRRQQLPTIGQQL